MKLNYWKTLKVGLAFAIIMVFWTAYDYVVPLLLEHAYGLPNWLRGLVMGLDNLLSLFLLPIFGRISDKTRTKWGKRTPFIVGGTILSVVLMIFVPISANKSLKAGEELREQITATWAEGYSYTDEKGNVYDSEALYTMIYKKGAADSDYCDYEFLKAETGSDSLETYLSIALNPELNEDGAPGEKYERIVETGINTYASDQVYQKVTLKNLDSLIIYMVILFFVLVSMATFRSPAVALMPDVTPKPLRSQANAMINLAGGAGGAVAFLIYTITLMINPTGYIAIFVAVACSMLIMLGLFLWLVKEPKLVRECEEFCAEYGISNDDDDVPENENGETVELSEEEAARHKRSRFISFLLILGSIFMWFMGYNAVSSNLSIYLTKILGLSSGFGGIVSGISMGISAIAFIPVGILAVKIGRRKSIMIGFGLATLAFILIFFFAVQRTTTAVVLYTLFYLISGFGLIIANVNTFPMVVELADSSDTGKYTGFYYAATMSAQAITPFIAGLVMDSSGSKYLFLYSTICVALAIVLMVFVKHGDSKAPPPKSKLEMLGAADD